MSNNRASGLPRIFNPDKEIVISQGGILPPLNASQLENLPEQIIYLNNEDERTAITNPEDKIYFVKSSRISYHYVSGTWINLASVGIIEEHSSDYTLTINDAGKILHMNKPSPIVLNIPLNSNVSFATGTMISVIQFGNGETTIQAPAGVLLNGIEANSVVISGKHNGVFLIMTTPDIWECIGSILQPFQPISYNDLTNKPEIKMFWSDTSDIIVDALTNNGYRIDTTNNDVTVNFNSAPVVGDRIGIKLLNNYHHLYIHGNGKKIEKRTNDIEIDAYDTYMFIYSGETNGWLVTIDIGSQDTVLNINNFESGSYLNLSDLPDLNALKNEAVQEAKQTVINTQIDDYVLQLTDAGKTIRMNKETANTVYIPLNFTVSFATGTMISVIQVGNGTTTITGVEGVIVNSISGGSAIMTGKSKAVMLIKADTDTWDVLGAVL